MDNQNEKKVSDLKANPRNPRTISKVDFKNLQEAMKAFGDLSGIVFNVRTGQLVGGHQRVQSFHAAGGMQSVVITHRFEQPNSVGTIAIGNVMYGDEPFGYREVDWPEDREIAANITANRISGEFDLDMLAEWDQWLQENNPDLLALTGQSNDEIARLLGQDMPKEKDEDDITPNKMSIALTDNQYIVVERAIGLMKAKRSFENELNRDLDGNAIFYICAEWINANQPQ